MFKEITDDFFKKQIIFLLNNDWTGNTDYYFPSQNSISLERKDIFKMITFRYYYLKKNISKYKRSILFLFNDNNGYKRSVIIFKDFAIYELDIKCNDEYYERSIFDISTNMEDNSIIIYDSFMIGGNKINKYCFSDRILESETFLHNSIIPNVNIKCTTYFDKIIDLGYVNEDEEIFMIPNYLPILTGINYSSFKWKNPLAIEIGLVLKENGDDIDLYSMEFRRKKLFAKIHFSDENGKKYINEIKSLDNYKDGCILDINIRDGRIIISKINETKTIATTIRSIEKILTLKRENITLEELNNLN